MNGVCQKVKRPCLFLILIFSGALLLSSCNNYKRNSTHQQVALSSIKKGEKLSKIYCQSCHLWPAPSLLDSKTWEKGVLPQMGPRLGIFNYDFQIYPTIGDKNIGRDFYPQQPVINLNEWQNILDYYEATSPDSLPSQQRKNEINVRLPLFQVVIPEINYASPATCYVKITKDSNRRFIISDAIKQSIYFLNKNLAFTDSIENSGPVVDLDFQENGILTCNIGVLNPNNGKFGKAESITFNSNGSYQKSYVLLDSLQRPVQILAADLNNDGKEDYIVCEFGFLTGALSWIENLGNDRFERHILRNVPGAIRVYLNDYNHDGLIDIWALFSQGEEGVFLFTNKGKGNFDQEEVLRFPPSYGSSSFELVDFDKDGFNDIIYTCGDNADYSVILKPYHGVYIFINDKKNHFKQKYFFPINGCYKAIASDFDQDGDLDIATISFFADYENQAGESFVYLENKKNFNFQPYSFPEAKIGRWLTMDAGDFDNDGKTDLILGNFSIGPVDMKHPPEWKTSPPFIVLKNIGK
jgi:hypothetical protein